jgi:hypothetical protein
MQHFSREQLLVLQFENCVQNPEKALRDTYQFLGVRDYSPGNVSVPVHEAKIPRVSLPLDFRAQLQRDYAEGVRALADHWEQIDLSLWPNFAALARH